VQTFQQRAFHKDADRCFLMIDRGEQATHLAIGGKRLDPDRALRRSRQHDLNCDRRAKAALAYSVEPGRREERGIGLSSLKLAQAGRHIAAKQHHLQIGPQPPDLRGAAR